MSNSEWMDDVIENSGSKIKASDVFTTMFTKNYLENPQCLLELGIAIVLDKPIVIIAVDGIKVPENLKKIAVMVETVDGKSKHDMKRAMRCIGKVLDDLGIINE